MKERMLMHLAEKLLHIGVAALMASASGIAIAKLPPPTPAQAQAAAEKKAQADAQAEKEKQELAASMDAIAARWRARAAANGWPAHPPTKVAVPVKALGAPAAQSSPSGQPGGRRGSAAIEAPIRSEKAGTAPPSEDVKKAPPDRPKQ
jgi:hypothetical protein